VGYAFKSDSSPRPRRSEAGYTLAETLIVLALIGLVSVIAVPVAGRLIRHSRGLGAFSSVRQVLATARLQAVKRGTNVVVEISLSDEKSIRLRTFQDRANDLTSPLPADEQTAAGNFQQDTFADPALNEPTLGEFTVAQGISVWKQGGTKNDLGEGAAFDKYAGDATVIDRIVFLPSGGIVPPQDTACGLPTTSGGRGLYFADDQGMNFFRVTVETNNSGKFRVDKYVAGSGYVTRGWSWN
jgi:prepilin-type N-terminal cleavage/methylation domain-containing protein